MKYYILGKYAEKTEWIPMSLRCLHFLNTTITNSFMLITFIYF